MIKMKNWLQNIILLALMTMASLHATAAEEPRDTLYFYDTWEQMLYLEPVAMIINPFYDAYSPWELIIDTGDEQINEALMKEHIAFSIGDSLWHISSDYLRNNFSGDASYFNGFVSLFFNEKTAFVINSAQLSVKDVLFGRAEDDYSFDYFNLDFLNHKVKRVTSGYLSELLEDYHDLQMRYEGMKDYKKFYIIEDYYFKYIDRATQDFMRPYIVDLVGN